MPLSAVEVPSSRGQISALQGISEGYTVRKFHHRGGRGSPEQHWGLFHGQPRCKGQDLSQETFNLQARLQPLHHLLHVLISPSGAFSQQR